MKTAFISLSLRPNDAIECHRTCSTLVQLTHWGRVIHICVGKLTIIGSDNGLLSGQCQAIIWINAGILLIGPLGTNFSEILFRIQIFLFKKMCLKMPSAKWHPFCLGLNVLMACCRMALPELLLTYQTMRYCGIQLRAISQKMPEISILNWLWKFLYII